jgi:transposase
VRIADAVGPLVPEKKSWQGRPWSCRAFEQVQITLEYLRTNATQAAVGERHGVSQPTVSRIVARVTALVAAVFGADLPTVDDLDPRETLLVDGTLAPCWSWKAHREDYNGKHRTTGRNLQVACSLAGTLRWVSDDLPGATHDTAAARTHGLTDANLDLLADRGYVGRGIITPVKRLPGQTHLADDQKEYNRQVSSVRSAVERCIAHIKTWKILATDYRRPWHTHSQTITAVIGLHFYRNSL